MKVIYTDKAPNSELYKQKRYGKLYTHHIAVFLFTYMFISSPVLYLFHLFLLALS